MAAPSVRQLTSISLWIFLYRFAPKKPPQKNRTTASFPLALATTYMSCDAIYMSRPCLSDADWCLRSDGVTGLCCDCAVTVL